MNFEQLMTEEPMNHLHRKVVEASKKAGLKLRHDNKLLDAAWMWCQCRVVHATVEDYLEAEWDKGDYSVGLKNAYFGLGWPASRSRVATLSERTWRASRGE